MAASSRARVREARARSSESELMRRAALRPAPPRLRLHSRFDVIAEIKPISPASGRLTATGAGAGAALIERARRYGATGAAAISVLTEPSAFGGSLVLLEALALATAVPVMRKDFLVEPYQVAEARDRGASGVLLIVRLLDAARLEEMLDAAEALGLFVLLEAFDEDDLERALAAASAASGDVVVGINARDLVSLSVDRDRLARLAAQPRGTVPLVAESGFTTPEEIAGAAALGYRAALVGEALMRDPDPSQRLAEMIAAGRNMASPREARG
jgi:indole-3-glycerol phosphate synthase